MRITEMRMGIKRWRMKVWSRRGEDISESEDVENGQLPNKKMATKRTKKNNMRIRKKISMSMRLRRNVNGV
jgi:hypothetical protein